MQKGDQVVAPGGVGEDAVDAKLVGAGGGVGPPERVQRRRAALCSTHLGIGRSWLLRLGRADDQIAAQLTLQAPMDGSGELFGVGSRQEGSRTGPVLATEATS